MSRTKGLETYKSYVSEKKELIERYENAQTEEEALQIREEIVEMYGDGSLTVNVTPHILDPTVDYTKQAVEEGTGMGAFFGFVVVVICAVLLMIIFRRMKALIRASSRRHDEIKAERALALKKKALKVPSDDILDKLQQEIQEQLKIIEELEKEVL